MTTFKQSIRMVSGVTLLAALCSAPVFSALPDNSYACQVETKGSGQGLVMVQAHTMQSAKKIARKFDALTSYGTRSPVKSLVQCIEAPEGRFSDAKFQSFYENLER